MNTENLPRPPIARDDDFDFLVSLIKEVNQKCSCFFNMPCSCVVHAIEPV